MINRKLNILLAVFLIANFASFAFFDFFAGKETDATYYNAYAIGTEDKATSLWPIILKLFWDIGLYDRQIFVWLNYSIYLYCAFFLLPNVALVGFGSINQDNRFIRSVLSLLLLVYPSAISFASDLFREVTMLIIFLYVNFSIAAICNSSCCKRNIINILIIIASLLLLYNLRVYLSGAILFAIAVSFISRINTPFRLFLGYVTLVSISYKIGFLDELLEYRMGYLLNDGSLTLGIQMLGDTLPEFWIKLCDSYISLVFGIIFHNWAVLLLFLIESLPVILMLGYVLRYMNQFGFFERYLLNFFLVYSLLIAISCDNLGTASRLRIFAYISVYILFARIWLHHQIILRKKRDPYSSIFQII